MTILVTGATGGLGRHLVEWLRSHKQEKIIATSRSESSYEDYFKCDLFNNSCLKEVIISTNPRLIYHLAASFTNDYEIDYRINTMAAYHILEILRTENIKARLVVMGSAAEYGRIKSKDNPIPEVHSLCPVSIYGLTKAFQTQYTLYHAHQFQSNVVIARLFNLLASGLSDKLFVGHIEKSIKLYLAGKIKEIVVGNLDFYRDYIEVGEAINQLNNIAERGSIGEIYHIASGKPMLIRDLLKIMLKEAHLDFSIVKERQHHNEKMSYDIPMIYADISKTKALEFLY